MSTIPQLERFKLIDRAISRLPYPSFDTILHTIQEELLEHKFSGSSLRRDIKYMQNILKAPICYDRFHNGYYYARPYNLPFNGLSVQEVEQLAIVKELLTQFDSDDIIHNGAANLISKLFPAAESPQFMERIVIPKRPKPVFDESVCHRLLEALRNNYLVDFHYKSKWEPDKIWRRVMPYQLVIDEGQIFLYAADENDETAARLYNLYRIHHLFVHKDRTFTLPKNFRFVEDFECGRWGAFQYDETYDYKIEFRGDARAYVHERIWADDQQFTEDEERGVTVMTFSSSQWIPIEHWLLSFGGNARPIEPDWFVEDWKKEVRKMTEWL